MSNPMHQSELSKQLSLGLPKRHGLYDPAFEKDSCGVGFICDIKGRASREIIEQARHINCCMVHRGGVGYEQNTGDGAGILTQIPNTLFQRECASLGFNLPLPGEYGVGMVFLPPAAEAQFDGKQA